MSLARAGVPCLSAVMTAFRHRQRRLGFSVAAARAPEQGAAKLPSEHELSEGPAYCAALATAAAMNVSGDSRHPCQASRADSGVTMMASFCSIPRMMSARVTCPADLGRVHVLTLVVAGADHASQRAGCDLRPLHRGLRALTIEGETESDLLIVDSERDVR